MKYINEYRDREAAEKYSQLVYNITTKPWNIMEVCGGQTHTIIRYGIDGLLPKEINLIHGPGCPVCVTSLELIDKSIEIASNPGVIFCSFGDMLRVPGSKKDLLTVKAEGGDVRMLYSPIDAVKIAEDNPDKEVVFFAVGFETTAPANAMAVYRAKQLGLKNFSILVSHVLVPPAMEAILSSENNRVQGFLAAGHVCSVTGYNKYFQIAKRYNVPIVVTGFEPLDILQGIYMCIKQLEESRAEVENQYTRAVKKEGNLKAQEIINKVFKVGSRKWRGIGEIPGSGLVLQDNFIDFDSSLKFGLADLNVGEPKECISGQILQGIKKPNKCSEFGTICTPEHPLGATMVSSEGACSAYYRYRKTQ